MEYLEMTKTDFNKMMTDFFKALNVLSVFAEVEDDSDAMRMVANECDCMTDTYGDTH